MTGPTRVDAAAILMELIDVPAAVPVERARAQDYDQVGRVLTRWHARDLDPARYRVVIDPIPRQAMA